MFDVEAMVSPKTLDCGATCLQMLLAYYGITIPLDELIVDCNTRRIGCTAGDLKKAGVKHGLDMKAYNMSAKELLMQDRPCIVWWKHNHFCIFCGTDDNGNVIICNPDRGRYRMLPKTFESFYCNVALFNGEPHDMDNKTVSERIADVEPVAEMAYVNSEISLALLEMEM